MPILTDGYLGQTGRAEHEFKAELHIGSVTQADFSANFTATAVNSVGQQVFVVAGRGFAMQAQDVKVSLRYIMFQK